jgi:diguanylate cyclase (GGDEF)-like protein
MERAQEPVEPTGEAWMALPSGAVDMAHFLSVLEGVRTVPFSGHFLADGTWHAPYIGPGIHRLMGGKGPPGSDDGAFWSSRVLPADRAIYDAGMAQQRRGEVCEIEYRINGLDGSLRWIRECARGTPGADGSMRVDGIVTDVSGQRASDDAVGELEVELRAATDRLASILANLDEYLYAWRFPVGEGPVVDFESVPLEDFLRQRPTSLSAEEQWLKTVHPEDRQILLDALARGAAGESGSAQYRVCDDAGSTRWLNDRWKCRREADGAVVVEGIVSDITTRRRAEDGMAAALASARVAYAELEEGRLAAEHASNTDPLTGLANRRCFEGALELAVTTAASRPFGLILLDVDHFKRTNDTYGHQTGDDVLVAVVERIRASCAPGAIIARWGGEEFTVLIPGVHTHAALRAAAERIRSRVRDAHLATRRGALAITISCGGVLATGERDSEELIHAADAAMYRAKQTGRDRTLLADDTSSGAPEDEPELLLTAQSFARTASIREGVPELHCAQVADLAGRIAVQLELPAATVLRCRLAGWLHDVGKIVIPDHVLSKPGRLDDAEWLLMETHAAFGSDLVARTPGIAESAAAVRHHHERWDGTGYPDRLAGTDIPLEARIVAAADTWNAMTQDRCYKVARDFESACSELREVAGTQLDPSVTEALLAVVREEHRDLLGRTDSSIAA